MPDLLQYFNTEEVLLQYIPEPDSETRQTQATQPPSLQVELDTYHKYQALVIDRVFELEKAIIETAGKEGSMDELLGKGKYDNVQFKPYMEWLKKRGLTNEGGFISMVRNKFSHSQFPPKAVVEQYMTIDYTAGCFSKQIYEVFAQKTEYILTLLRQNG